MTKKDLCKEIIFKLRSPNDNRHDILYLCQEELIKATPKEELILHLWKENWVEDDPFSGEYAHEFISKRIGNINGKDN